MTELPEVDCRYAQGAWCWHDKAPPGPFGVKPKCSMANGATCCPWRIIRPPLKTPQDLKDEAFVQKMAAQVEEPLSKRYAREELKKFSDKLHAIFDKENPSERS